MSWEGDVEGIVPFKKINVQEMDMDKKYFTAQEARAVANEVRDKKFNEELSEIYNLIDNARYEGKTSITMNRFIDKLSEEFLENKGFTVKMYSGCQWDPAHDTIISW